MTSLEQALALIDAFVERRMAGDGTPGAALAISDGERTVAVRAYGLADVAARAPVTPDTLFEIGSIGKAFTAIALLQEAERGRVDLRRPVSAALPWFELPTPFDPVTPHHLLCHTAGIPAGPDFTPEARYQVWALRELAAASPPGARFHYSNLGYKALGVLLEHVAGLPYEQVIGERILRPLGMDASAPEITNALRPRLAVGYGQLHADYPWHPAAPLAPAPWLETRTGDGCVAATAGDMAAFARMLLGRGRAPGGRVLSEESFALFSTPQIAVSETTGYGYGINVERLDGRTRLRHPGGMPGYSANIICDMDDGLAAVALVNGPGSPSAIATFALAVLRAGLRGEALPELPAPREWARVEGAAGYAGAYESAGGARLELAADGERLLLAVAGEQVALEGRGGDTFYVPHPAMERFLLRFGRDEAGAVTDAGHGLEWYAGAGYAGPRASGSPPAWGELPGTYRSYTPWVPQVSVALRRGQPTIIWAGDYDGAGDDEEPLVPLADGSFRIGQDELGPERARFDTLVDGRALRLTLSGSPMYRV